MNTTELQPKMSIVVPCYNTQAYLPRCLDSLLAQTLSDIEIICVNDGSPDNCLAIINEYANRYPALIRVVNIDNAGIWNARWSGTDVARGDYVVYVDSDDYVDPAFADDLYTAAVQYDADIVVCGFKRIEESTGKVVSCEMDTRRAPFTPSQDPGKLIEINTAVWNKAFRRHLLMETHRLEAPATVCEDMALLQLAYLAGTKPVAFTGTAPYRYVIHETSAINSVTTQQVDEVKTMLLEVRKFYEQENAGDNLMKELDAVAFLHLGVSMSFRLSCNPNFNLAASIKETTDYLNEYFPTWKNSPFINGEYAKQGPAFSRLRIAQRMYKMHAMKPFLALYRFAIEKLHIDIKW